jgi:hypothetical protein
VFSPSGVSSYSTKGTNFDFLRAMGFPRVVLSCILARLVFWDFQGQFFLGGGGAWVAPYPSSSSNFSFPRAMIFVVS